MTPLEPAAETKQKFDMKWFLKRYRSLGLPNAKKFRKKFRIEKLKEDVDLYTAALFEAARRQARANYIIQELIKESNFAVREETNGDIILWVADDEPLENARKYLKEFNGASPLRGGQLQQPEPSRDSQSAYASSAPIAPDDQL